VRESLLKGFFVVAGTPSLLVGAALLLLGVWLSLVALGIELSPSLLISVLAIPPFTTSFDIGVGPGLFGGGAGAMFVTIGILVARSAVIALAVAVMVEVMESDEVTGDAPRRAFLALPSVVSMNLLAFVIVAVGQILGAFLGPVLSLFALPAGLYFLGFVPAAAVRERRRTIDVVRRAGRAARLPGAGHLLYVSLYFLFVFLVAVLQPPADITSNPSISTWVTVLLGTFVHLVFLAGLCYRWIEVEPSVPEEPIRRSRPAQRSRR
jgi:hypothetical protein